jgi:hypothetical protein
VLYWSSDRVLSWLRTPEPAHAERDYGKGKDDCSENCSARLSSSWRQHREKNPADMRIADSGTRFGRTRGPEWEEPPRPRVFGKLAQNQGNSCVGMPGAEKFFGFSMYPLLLFIHLVRIGWPAARANSCARRIPRHDFLNEKLELSRTSENLGNRNIDPVYFCRVDVLATKCVERDWVVDTKHTHREGQHDWVRW